MHDTSSNNGSHRFTEFEQEETEATEATEGAKSSSPLALFSPVDLVRFIVV
jgi:hypothetical protein